MEFLAAAIVVLFCLINVESVITKKDSPEWKSQNSAHESEMHTWDFEFDDKQEQGSNIDTEKSFLKAAEIISENDLCKNLQCKPHQVCLVEDDDVAVCISKRKLSAKETALKSSTLKKNKNKEQSTEELFWEKGEGDSEKEDSSPESQNPCIPCPVLKPEFVCGSDNHTYSSVCRLEFRNCMHKAAVGVNCKGFCPCKPVRNEGDKNKEWQMKERWNRYMNKYQNTIKKPVAVQKPPKKPHTSNQIIKNVNQQLNNFVGEVEELVEEAKMQLLQDPFHSLEFIVARNLLEYDLFAHISFALSLSCGEGYNGNNQGVDCSLRINEADHSFFPILEVIASAARRTAEILPLKLS